MDISKELEENQTILLLIPSTEYARAELEIMQSLSGKNVCYVTLNKTCESLVETFKKKGINLDNIVFIDAIAKTFSKAPDQRDKCYYVSSPAALTEIAIEIDVFLKHGYDYLVFDSLTNLLIYEKKAPIAKFVASLVNKIRQSKTKAVFYAASIHEQDAMIEETGMFVDKVIVWK